MFHLTAEILLSLNSHSAIREDGEYRLKTTVVSTEGKYKIWIVEFTVLH